MSEPASRDKSMERVDSLVHQFKRSCIIFPNEDNAARSPPEINDFRSLSEHLPFLSSAVFRSLGSQQLEATYQRCLKIDLEEAGVKVTMEKEIQLVYKGRVVGTRRADLILETPASGEVAVVEIKAVAESINPGHVRQLEFYMHHMGVDRGYLINFPHDGGFPRVEDETREFAPKVLFGDLDTSNIHARLLRLRNAPDSTEVQIVELERRTLSAREREAAVEDRARSIEEAKSGRNNVVYGITQKGTPCKVCIKEERFCKWHKKQAPN